MELIVSAASTGTDVTARPADVFFDDFEGFSECTSFLCKIAPNTSEFDKNA
jgi:hypothetical protein